MLRLFYFVLFTFVFPKVYSQYLPIENIFLCSERTEYSVGDTIRVEGQVVRMDNNATTKPYSRYAYVELIDNVDSVVVRKKVVCDECGSFLTHLPVSQELKNGDYYLRSYTKFMCNYLVDTFPVSQILIGAGGKMENHGSISCRFYPEGTNSLIAGVPQNVGIKVEDGSGFPISADITLFTQHGDTLQHLRSTDNGWQVLRFVPQQGMHYSMQVTDGHDSTIMALPSIEDVVSLQTILQNNRLITRIINSSDCNMEGWKICIEHPSIGLQLYPITRNVLMSDLDGISDGLLAVFLLNPEQKVMAQSFKWYSSPKPDLELLSVKTENGFLSAQWGTELDSMAQVFYRIVPQKETVHSAEAMLKYENSLVSQEQYPYPLLEETTKERKIDEEAWLYSAQYKRMDIEKILKNGIDMAILPEQELVISGFVNQKNYGKVKDGSIVIYQASNHNTYTGIIDHNAYFRIPVNDYSEYDYFFVQAYNKQEKADIYEYEFLSDTLPGVHIRKYVKQTFLEKEIGNPTSRKFSFDGLNELPEIIVKSRLMQERPKDDTKVFYKHKYISEETMDQRHFASFQQVVDYFFVYMHLLDNSDTKTIGGSVVFKSGGEFKHQKYKLVNRRRNDEVKILLDGSLITTDEAMNLNMDFIATVEYFSPSESIRYVANGYGGVLILNTKKYKQEKVASKGVYYVSPLGISNYHSPRDEAPVMMPAKTEGYSIYVDVISPVFGIRSYIK